MKIREVPAHKINVSVVCLACKEKASVGKDQPPVYADLDGKAFHAYYHAWCRPDHPPILRDLVLRTQRCREAGGSVNDGSARDGYCDYRSLRIMIEQARSRMTELAMFERPKGGPIEPEFEEDIRDLNENRRVVAEAEKLLTERGVR